MKGWTVTKRPDAALRTERMFGRRAEEDRRTIQACQPIVVISIKMEHIEAFINEINKRQEQPSIQSVLI